MNTTLHNSNPIYLQKVAFTDKVLWSVMRQKIGNYIQTAMETADTINQILWLF